MVASLPSLFGHSSVGLGTTPRALPEGGIPSPLLTLIPWDSGQPFPLHPTPSGPRVSTERTAEAKLAYKPVQEAP